MKKIVVFLAFATLATPAFAHDFSQPSLLSALVHVGHPGGINAAAKVASPHALADVKVGAGQPAYGYGHGAGAPSSSLLGLNVVVPGIARANADIGQQSRHGSALLGVTANVLDGGAGRRGGW
jgi:hypothetical protein